MVAAQWIQKTTEIFCLIESKFKQQNYDPKHTAHTIKDFIRGEKL